MPEPVIITLARIHHQANRRYVNNIYKTANYVILLVLVNLHSVLSGFGTILVAHLERSSLNHSYGYGLVDNHSTCFTNRPKPDPGDECGLDDDDCLCDGARIRVPVVDVRISPPSLSGAFGKPIVIGKDRVSEGRRFLLIKRLCFCQTCAAAPEKAS